MQNYKHDYSKAFKMIQTEAFLNKHLEESLPFVLYAKPNSSILVSFFQQDYHVYTTDDYLDKGFVFAPFEGDENVFFPIENCEILTENFSDIQVSDSSFIDNHFSANGKEMHINLVKKGIEAIKNEKILKVVLSRKETININDVNFLESFKRILKHYPTAFRYLFFHPQIGFWMGASPEQLLKQKDNKIYTVSLAGTQLKKDNEVVIWQKKEIVEQQIVTDFIVKNLQNYISEISISTPFTFQAGSLAHIKTDIAATLLNNLDFTNVLRALHPTPALCGMPKDKAKSFIIENEGYEREFYSGFLGELHYNPITKAYNESDIFVNLRCMQMQFEKVHLYLGGGITKDSNPEDEFYETVNKSKTIKKVL